MKFATNLLRINAVLFIVFGACFIAAPAAFATAITGDAPVTPSALIDMRATYGGMGMGIGLMFGFCARQRETIYTGLFGSILVLATMALVRVVGFVVEGSPNVFMLLMFGAEVFFVALLAMALKRLID